MINNSTNINKANNHIYLISLNIKQTMTYPGLGQAQKYGWGNPVNEITPLASWSSDLQLQ